MEQIATVAAIVGFFIVILADRPERKPGNLTPIQFISAAGAWALIFANASAMAIAIRDGSLILFVTAAGTLAIALISFLRDHVAPVANRHSPEALRLVVDDLKQLLGGAPRLGMDTIEAVVVAGNGPGIGVTVRGQGKVLVRVRQDVVRWLERHQRGGGAGAAVIASFVRFIVLHELGHVLNGDHRTFRFVRAVLMAHLVWIAGAVTMSTSYAFDRAEPARPLIVATSIVLLFVVQGMIARRFIAERESLADWRAMQALSPADAAQLLERRGRRRAAANPTELEKLMIDLKAQVPPGSGGGLLSRLVLFVWPEGDDIHRRTEAVGGDHQGAPPQPVLWAALIGMQSGLLAMSLGTAVLFAVAPWMLWRHDLTEAVMLASLACISAPAVAFCELRVNPSRMSVRVVKRASDRLVVAVVFYLAFVASALAMFRFQVGFGIPSMLGDLHFAALLVIVAVVVAVCVWFTGPVGPGDGGGELLGTPQAAWANQYPVLAGMALLLPLSTAGSHWLGLGSLRSGQWIALAFMSFAAFVVSTSMARSTNPTLRAISPMALLDTPAPVYGYRLFWRDFYVDLSRVSLARAALIAVAVQAVAMPFFVLATGLLMKALHLVLTAQQTFLTVFFSAFGVMALILVIPDRYRAYGGPWMRLLDTSRLQLFEKLLAAARTASPAAAERLRSALAQWLRHDRFPETVLPDARAVWPLAPLLILVRLARESGETAALERWRDRIGQSLRQIVADDAVAMAPGHPPSMHWTTLAAAIVDEAGLTESFPFERMLDRIETMLDERLSGEAVNLVTDVVEACRLLRRRGRRGPDPHSIRRFARSWSLMSRPRLRQSLAELCEIAELTGDAELREKLGPIVRSRSWEVIQLNPRKDVLLLLDCHLAAACLGETDSRQAAAAKLIGEVALRASDELVAVTSTANSVRRRTTASAGTP